MLFYIVGCEVNLSNLQTLHQTCSYTVNTRVQWLPVWVHICVYIDVCIYAILYIYTVCMYIYMYIYIYIYIKWKYKHTKYLCQDHRIKTLIVLYIAVCNIAQKSCIWVHFLKWVVYNHSSLTEEMHGSSRVFQVFNGLISIFVFDILQIPSRCIQICRECIAPTCTLLAMDVCDVDLPSVTKIWKCWDYS